MTLQSSVFLDRAKSLQYLFLCDNSELLSCQTWSGFIQVRYLFKNWKLLPLKKFLPGTSVKSIKALWKLWKQNTAPKPRTKQSYQNLGKLPNVFISSWLNRFSHYDQDYFTRQREAHVWVSTVTELLLLPVRSQAHHEGNREEPVLLLLHLLLKWNTSLPSAALRHLTR